MKRLIIAFAALTLLGLVGANTALAQGKDKVVYRKKTVVDFEDGTVDGELTRPDGGYILNRTKTKFSSLIKYRPHFLKRMWKNARKL